MSEENTQGLPPEPQPETTEPAVEVPPANEEAKPVGEAIIVDTEPVVEQFPPHDETNSSK